MRSVSVTANNLFTVEYKEYDKQKYIIQRSRQYSLSAKGRYLLNLLRRGNYGLFGSTLKLGVESAFSGRFGERPKGRR